jgi:hypothetical protein
MNSQLERQLGENLRGLVASQPFEPDPEAIERRVQQDRRRRTVRTRAGVGAGLAAAVALSATAVAQPWASQAHPAKPGGHPQAAGPAPAVHPRTSAASAHPRTSASAPAVSPVALSALAHHILAGGQPSGDATLVVRTQSYRTHPTVTVDDLYTDSGEYFFAHTASGLPAQIKSNNNQGDGVFAREVAAGVYADHGDLATARHQMADAPLPSATPAAGQPGPDGRWPVTTDDNYIWENSLDALIAGSGKPQVRAGVLRILSTLPEVAVTSTTTGGEPTLTLRATGAAVAEGLVETMIIDATTGVPMKLTVAAVGQPVDATVTYQVSRVTLSQLVSGG